MKRYEKIVGMFTKAIKQLEDLNVKCENKVSLIDQQQEKLKVEKAGEKAEGKKAMKTAKKLREMLGDDEEDEEEKE